MVAGPAATVNPQHGIDLERVHSPAAAEAYARRLAQRDIPVAALLRAYRIGSARFQDWCLEELGRRTDNASIVSAAGLRIADITATYLDRVSEEVLAAYEAEKENRLRTLSAARAARLRALLSDERVDVDSSESILGYRLRQHHVGMACWVNKAEAGGRALVRLEHAADELARRTECKERPIFLPQDESSAPGLGCPSAPGAPSPLRPRTPALPMENQGSGSPSGCRRWRGRLRRTHRQALGAYAVALATGPSGPRMTSFADVAPLALMSSSIELLRTWVDRDTRHRSPPTTTTTPAPRHPVGLPAGEGQLQGHRRTAHAAQLHCPVPGPQGRGGPRPSHRRSAPAGRTGSARGRMVGRDRPAAGRKRRGRLSRRRVITRPRRHLRGLGPAPPWLGWRRRSAAAPVHR